MADLFKGGKELTAYYGTAPTGPVHIGYFVPLSKVFDFEKAGIKTTILIADIHAALDDQKTMWEELDKKVEYYKKCIELGFDWGERPKFIRGSDFQLDKRYVMDVLKIASATTIKRALRAASEVTRMKEPKISELVYPIMQALDEEYLHADIQLGGIDQRHIMAFAREHLAPMGYKKRVEVMMPLITSLQGPGVKMSASLPLTHIKVYESEESIRNKINKAYCPPGIAEDNPILQMAKFFIFGIGESMWIKRDAKFGGDIKAESYEQLEKMYKEKLIHPTDLKAAVIESLIKRFGRARKYFDNNTDLLRDLGEGFFP